MEDWRLARRALAAYRTGSGRVPGRADLGTDGTGAGRFGALVRRPLTLGGSATVPEWLAEHWGALPVGERLDLALTLLARAERLRAWYAEVQAQAGQQPEAAAMNRLATRTLARLVAGSRGPAPAPRPEVIFLIGQSGAGQTTPRGVVLARLGGAVVLEADARCAQHRHHRHR